MQPNVGVRRWNRRAAPPRRRPTPEFRGRIEPRAEGTRLTGMVAVDVPPVLLLAWALTVRGVTAKARHMRHLLDRVLARRPG